MAWLKKSKHRLFEEDDQSERQRMVSGSAWMTAGSFASRILGAIYVIPWLWMIGSSKDGELANGLMSVGYRIYNVFLAIATAGLPAALSKTVAFYNEKKQYRNAWIFFVRASVLMVALGLFSAALMYLTAPLVAARSPKVNFDDAVMVIRSLAPAVAIIPVMSLIRGFIQGHHQMAPSALSQFYEQVARVAYMLAATYVVMRVYHGPYALAVAHSTFAAFVGAILSLAYLITLIYRQKDQLFDRIQLDPHPFEEEGAGYYWHMMKEALPFVLFASGTELFGLIDQLSYQQLMTKFTQASPVTIMRMYGVFSFNVQKLVMIVISVAASIGITSLPLISGSFARGDKGRLGHLIEENLGLFMLVMMPASFGLCVAAEPLYNVFYAPNAFGSHYLRLYALLSIFLGLFMVLGYILQAINLSRHMVIGLGIGLVLKALWQPFMVKAFLEYGTAVSTFVGILATVAYFLYIISHQVQLRWAKLLRDLGRILVMSGLMSLGAGLVFLILKLIFPMERKLYALISLLVVAAVGGLIYALLTLINGQADRLLGSRADRLRARLHLTTYSKTLKEKLGKKSAEISAERAASEEVKKQAIESGEEKRLTESSKPADLPDDPIESEHTEPLEEAVSLPEEGQEETLKGDDLKEFPDYSPLTYPEEEETHEAKEEEALAKLKAEEEKQWGFSILLDSSADQAEEKDSSEEVLEPEEEIEEAKEEPAEASPAEEEKALERWGLLEAFDGVEEGSDASEDSSEVQPAVGEAEALSGLSKSIAEKTAEITLDEKLASPAPEGKAEEPEEDPAGEEPSPQKGFSLRDIAWGEEMATGDLKDEDPRTGDHHETR